MYTIIFPIALLPLRSGVAKMDRIVARDVMTQYRYEPALRVIFLENNKLVLQDPVEITIADYPGLSIETLSWNGSLKSLPFAFPSVLLQLRRAAMSASVWHVCCSTKLFDVTHLSYNVGRVFANCMRVLCLDSDPAAMLSASGGRRRKYAAFVRERYRRWLAQVDLAIFVGAGVAENYARFSRSFVQTSSVWLEEGDLSSVEACLAKFSNFSAEPIRIFLPSRLATWKGVDDVIQALLHIGDRLPAWRLDIMGEGDQQQSLTQLAAPLGQKVRFLTPLPYGPRFFEALRSYHIVLAPTRAVEEVRIVYDAAASGCVILHSRTSTLEAALSGLEPRWSFTPGSVASVEQALQSAFEHREEWCRAGLAGIRFMTGRTIDEMHRARKTAVDGLRLKCRSN